MSDRSTPRRPAGATPEGTAAYRDRLGRHLAAGHFRSIGRLSLSSIGLGSYLGEPDASADEGYRTAAIEALRLGCNFIDTAVNYRFQRSERALGRAIGELGRSTEVPREAIVVATKGGFIPFDGGVPSDPRRYILETFVKPGMIKAQDLVAGMHCMAPDYLQHQVETSSRNLGLECIDIYYIHNPETQLKEVAHPQLLNRLRAAFERLERLASEGRLQFYGTATWSGYRVEPGAPGHLSLEEVVGLAREVAGERHRFRFVQAPLNLAMPEAIAQPSQTLGRERVSLLEAAGELGVHVVASASILQGRLARGLPEEFSRRLPGLPSDVLRSLQFVRSAPGVASALVGMSRVDHVRENLKLAAVAPLSEREFVQAFQ